MISNINWWLSWREPWVPIHSPRRVCQQRRRQTPMSFLIMKSHFFLAQTMRFKSRWKTQTFLSKTREGIKLAQTQTLSSIGMSHTTGTHLCHSVNINECTCTHADSVASLRLDYVILFWDHGSMQCCCQVSDSDNSLPVWGSPTVWTKDVIWSCLVPAMAALFICVRCQWHTLLIIWDMPCLAVQQTLESWG